MKRRSLVRLLALALAMTILFAQPVAAWAEQAPSENAAAAAAAPQQPAARSFWGRNIGVFSYWFDTNGYYFYNTKYSPQWLFGFNKMYDLLSPLAGCMYDTLRCRFQYGGSEWMVQLWKGAYGFGALTGGEIGFYKRTLGSYYGASRGNWISMQFTIFENAYRCFTTPMEKTWWATGYQPHILKSPYAKPRANCTMDATLVFQNPEMAAAFAGSLAEKGFAMENGLVFNRIELNTERYSLDGSTVRLLWRNKTEGFF